MTLNQFQELTEIVDVIDPHRDSDLAALVQFCQGLEAVETLAYLQDCERRRLTPRLVMIHHLINVDYSGSGSRCDR